jgi:hypothetical protein
VLIPKGSCGCKFNENRPQLLGIGLKKKNWYDIVHEMRNITNLVRDIEFNHTVITTGIRFQCTHQTSVISAMASKGERLLPAAVLGTLDYVLHQAFYPDGVHEIDEVHVMG